MATMTIEGRRIYVTTRYGEPVVAELKRLGAHWDAESKRWWLASAKKDAVAALVAGASPTAELAQPSAEDPDNIRLVGKAAYKGRTYFVRAITQDGTRCRLVTLDQSLDFWADMSAVEVVKRYTPREERGRYGRSTGRMTYTTLGSIQRFIEREKANRTAGGGVCAECGKGGELVADLEDGMLKHRRCCDIEP